MKKYAEIQMQEKFKDIKGVIRSRKSKKDRQDNDQEKKKQKGQITIYKTLHRKLKIFVILTCLKKYFRCEGCC